MKEAEREERCGNGAGVRMMHFEDGGKDAGSWKRQGNRFSPNLQKKCSYVNPYFSSINPFQTSDLQNCTTINLCCFKPLVSQML